METTDQLAARLTISQAVDDYRKCEADIRLAFDLIAKAQRKLADVFGKVRWSSDAVDPILVATQKHGRMDVDFDKPDSAMKTVNIQIWGVLVERLELRRLMSIKAWDELQKQIDNGEMPPITAENIQGVFRGFAGSVDVMIAESVREVYDWLRPWRIEHKTNAKNARWELGEKIIVQYMVERGWHGEGRFRINYSRQQHATALQNVFSALDGKGPIAKSAHGDLFDSVAASADGTGETEYFKFRCFRNGNMHLRFKRLDLLKRFNEVAGGKRLKPENVRHNEKQEDHEKEARVGTVRGSPVATSSA